MAVYLYADVGSAGLCNRLWAWARCDLARRETGLPMLAPQWVRLKLGPLLRGERDSRLYLGLFNTLDYVAGLRRTLVMAFGKRVPESALQQAQALARRTWRPVVVTFCGGLDSAGRNCCEPLFGDAPYLLARLEAMTAEPHRRRVESLAPREPTIMVHLRRGDFGAPVPFGEIPRDGLHALSNEWLIACIRSVRAAVGELPVRVTTDAEPSALADVLALPDVRLCCGGSSIADLLLLSRASVLVGSPGSTFSAWAALLGRMPSVWVPNYFSAQLRTGGWPVCEADGWGKLVTAGEAALRAIAGERGDKVKGG